MTADVEIVVDKRIQDAKALAHLVLGEAGQLVVAGIGEVVEVTGTHKRAHVIAVVQMQFAGGFHRVRERAA